MVVVMVAVGMVVVGMVVEMVEGVKVGEVTVAATVEGV